jgi:ribosomal-protein-alanine N-acetyltransferase
MYDNAAPQESNTMVETERLIVRNASFADCDDFAEWESVERVVRYFSISGKRDLDIVTKDFHDALHDPTRQWLTIILKESNKPIGRVGITRIDRICDSMDITLLYIVDDYQGRGLGIEAIKAVLEYAFKEQKMERVSLDYAVENEAAANLYNKLGFHKEGIMRNAGKRDGKYYDMQLCSILREEWEELNEVAEWMAKEKDEAHKAKQKG